MKIQLSSWLFALTVLVLIARATCDNLHEEVNSELFSPQSDRGEAQSFSYSPQGLDFGILAWIHNTEGGYYNPKQEFRTQDPNDPTSLTGVFAKERIEKGELLCRVPSTHWITDVVNETERCQMCCGLVRKLAHHMTLGDQSEFAVYMRYINALPENQIPSVWSTQAQDLLLKVIGMTREESMMSDELSKIFPPSRVVSWIQEAWYDTCQGDPNDLVEIKAAVISLMRTDDELMIPAYDFVSSTIVDVKKVTLLER